MTKKVKLESLIPSQLPSHIREDYPTFEAFMKAYYRYLDQQKLTRSLEFVRDIDETLDVFVENIKDEIAVLAPRLAKDRFFLKHAKEFYVSRGSEESYKFLFRLLYNKDVDVVQLNEKTLKASGGNWQQDVSFFIKLESGNIASLENNFVYINSVTEAGVRRNHEKVYVKKIQRVEFTANQDIYEVFINRQYFGKIIPGDTIDDRGVKATLVPTTVSIEVTKPGSGFRIGQIFNISTTLGQGLQAKVIAVDRATGGLKALQVIGFGIGFEQPFDYNITRFEAAVSSQTVSPNLDGLVSVNTTDVLTDGKDYGFLTRQSYHTQTGIDPNAAYVAGDYVGEVLADFYSRSYPSDVEVTVATLRVNLGSLAVYPGFYSNSHSLISDDSYIQDGYYYQDFSYLLRIDEKLTDYKEIITSTLHPVGRKMFGDFLVEQDYDLTYEVFNPIIRLFFPLAGTDEEVNLIDRVISSVVSEEFVGNNADVAFTFLDNPTEVNYLLLNVRKGFGGDLQVVLPAQYTQANGVVTFNIAPLAGERIITTYATINYNSNPLWLNHTTDMHKPLVSSNDGVIDSSIRGVTKLLSPATGYIDEALPTDVRTNAFSKVLNAANGYTDEALPEDAISTKGFGKRLTDALDAPTDAALVLTSKALVDLTGASTTSVLYSFTKNFTQDSGLNEIINATDNTATLVFGKRLDDIAEIQEQAAVGFTFAPFSSVNITLEDLPAVETSKGLSDSVSSSILTTFTTDKYLSDSVDMLDQALLEIMYGYTDEVLVIDAFQVTNGDGAYLSQVGAEDLPAFTLERTLEDPLNNITTNAWLQLNPYSSEAYFPNGYQSGGNTNL